MWVHLACSFSTHERDTTSQSCGDSHIWSLQIDQASGILFVTRGEVIFQNPTTNPELCWNSLDAVHTVQHQLQRFLGQLKSLREAFAKDSLSVGNLCNLCHLQDIWKLEMTEFKKNLKQVSSVNMSCFVQCHLIIYHS